MSPEKFNKIMLKNKWRKIRLHVILRVLCLVI